MSLAPQTRLGPYEIVAPLGAGGMGEVYRARDPRLGRDVAIKVLPQHLSSNPEVRARFEREAKTVSSLNHPHICTLFDVGREGDTDYLVMELIEGETLAQRLSKGALPAAEVLRLGAQIADALDRAHRAGVVHRDLKPGNVMLTKSGAKLMDFGLARATGLAGGSSSGVSMAGLTQSPTMAAPLTAEGSIVGTFQYMAPEQLEGKEADTRSDLWALGCVLYEMATGKRAFDGSTQASLISAIMRDQPRAMSDLSPMSPPALERLVRNCLAKDPDERVQTAHDVKLQLQGIAEGGSQAGAPAPVIARRHGRERLAWTIAVIGIVSAIAAIAALVLFGSRGLDAGNPVQLAITPPVGAHFEPNWASAAISPDGRSLVFAASDSSTQRGLWLQRLDSPEATRLAGAEHAISVFWSPDGRSVGYLDALEGKLKTIAIAGGTPVTLCAAPGGRGGSWNSRGDILFAPVPQGPLFRVAASGGEPAQATWVDSTRHESAHRFPCFLPDGDHFLYASLPPGPEGFDIYVGSLSSRATRKILSASSAATYVAPGHLLFVRGSHVMAQRFDARGLKVEGDPLVLGDAPPQTDVDAETVASASRDGRLVFRVAQTPETHFEWLDGNGRSLGALALPVGKWGQTRLSPDDRYAASVNGNDLWRLDLQRLIAIRLTSNDATNSDPVWSPDGARIAFTMGHKGREEIQVMNADGSGEAQTLTTNDDLFKSPEDWSRDGLAFNSIGSQTSRDLWLIQPSKDSAPVPLARTRFLEWNSRISPDGHWIAYISNEAGTSDVYVQSFPVPGHKTRVSRDGAVVPHWMPGNDELRFRRPNDLDMLSVGLTRHGDDLEVGEPRTLFRMPAGIVNLAFTHDGQRALATVPNGGGQEGKLRVILNWTALVKR